MKITGTDSHLSKRTAATAIRIRKYLGQLSFNEKFLNFKLMIGRVETIRYETKKMIPKRNHLFNNNCITHASFTFQYIRGNDAINKPAAGTGTPLNEYCCELSKLNLARR